MFPGVSTAVYLYIGAPPLVGAVYVIVAADEVHPGIRAPVAVNAPGTVSDVFGIHMLTVLVLGKLLVVPGQIMRTAPPAPALPVLPEPPHPPAPTVIE
jgi:glycine/D-amino acid oxidase-like deaminating enzyme